MPSSQVFRFRDYGGEKSSFECPGILINAGNYAANEILLQNLSAALDLVTIGVIEHAIWKTLDDNISSAPVTNPFAQRETKWFVTLRGDSSLKLYSREIPTADLALLAPNSEEMIEGTQRTQLIDAIEAVFRGDANETATVISIKHVGRNT